jgi:hypothetical protein
MIYDEIRFGMSDTTPLIGDLKDAGHQNGASFLLFLKDNVPASDNVQPVSLKNSGGDYGIIAYDIPAPLRVELTGPNALSLELEGTGTVENSPPGVYAVVLSSGTLNESLNSIMVEKGKSVNIGDVRTLAMKKLNAQKGKDERTLKTKNVLSTAGLASIVVGGIGSAASYFLGTAAMDKYLKATTSADIDAAMGQVKLYSTIFIASAAAGGTGAVLLPVSALVGSDRKKLEANIKLLDEKLAELRNAAAQGLIK